MKLVFIILSFQGVAALQQESEYPTGDPRRCLMGPQGPKYRFEVIPGGGWDNLRNEEMGMLVKKEYTLCRTTEDGRYLLPDGMYTIPIKSSKVETYAELIEHWDNFTSTLAKSINIDVNSGMLKLSGKYSDEYQSVKQHQYNDKSFTTRVQARYVSYKSKLEPDAALNDAARKRLHRIAASVILNRTEQARYDSQLFVRDYGTQVITSIDVGAAIVQIDHLNMEYMKSQASRKSKIVSAASLDFFTLLNISASYSSADDQNDVKEYRQQRTSSKVLTYGGPLYRPLDFSANSWADGMENELVAIDRSGDPIYYLVNEDNLPNVPQSVVYDVYDHVKEAVDLYYERNTIRGCTNMDSPNFSFQANVDDGTCIPPKMTFQFGGAYQLCSGFGYDASDICPDLSKKNPHTGEKSCPPGFVPIFLHDGRRERSKIRRSCKTSFFIEHCEDKSYSINEEYSAYWCTGTSQDAKNNAFLFGGVYTSFSANLVTQSRSCPPTFYAITLLKDLSICVSDDFELGSQYALPFAGFFSCMSGNPASYEEYMSTQNQTSKLDYSNYFSFPRTCPKGYSQHLAVVDNGCSINYCVKSGAIVLTNGLPPVQRPPFMEAPRTLSAALDISDSVVISDDGDLWTTLNNADEMVPQYLMSLDVDSPNTSDLINNADKTAPQYLKSLGVDSPNTSDLMNNHNESKHTSYTGLSGAGIACIVLSVILALGLLISIIIYMRRPGCRIREYIPIPLTRDRRSGNDLDL